MSTAPPASPPLLDYFASLPRDGQDSSPLFRLPLEIRCQIYVELWRLYSGPDGGGLAPHIGITPRRRIVPGPSSVPSSAAMAHAENLANAKPGRLFFVVMPCFDLPHASPQETSPDDPDAIQSDQQDLPPITFPSETSRAGEESRPRRHAPVHLGYRKFSHLQCQREFEYLPSVAHERPFLPILRTCRRIYVEAIKLLYASLTFQFNDMGTAEAFLYRWPCVTSLRLYLKIPSTALEIYLQGSEWLLRGIAKTTQDITYYSQLDPEDRFTRAPSVADPQIPEFCSSYLPQDASVMTWRRLCWRLAALPCLRRLYVFVDTGDLRQWHKVAHERRLFQSLLIPRQPNGALALVPPGKNAAEPASRHAPAIVISLPTIPEDADELALDPDCYLVNDNNTNYGGSSDRQHDESFPENDPPLRLCVVRRMERKNNWNTFLQGRALTRRRLSISDLFTPPPAIV